MIKSFDPLIFGDTQVLIIGTMPSEASLAAGEYYAFRYNAFWPIIGALCGKKLYTYEQKKQALQKMRLGLWDNLQYCRREGSSDSRIRDEIPNDFTALLQVYPQIKKLLFNGKKSADFFKKYQPVLWREYSHVTMPSTSSANARLSLEQKTEIWRQELVL